MATIAPAELESPLSSDGAALPPLPAPSELALEGVSRQRARSSMDRSAKSCVIATAVNVVLIVALGFWSIEPDRIELFEPQLVADLSYDVTEPEFKTLDIVVAEHESQASQSSGGAGSSGGGGGLGYGGTTAVGMPGREITLAEPGTTGRLGMFGDDVSPNNLLSGLGDGPTGVNFFGVNAAGNKFVFVVDVSGSMNEGNRLKRAKDELRRTISSLRQDQQFYVVFYNHGAISMPGGELLDANKENLFNAFKWVNNQKAFGQTNPAPALEIALSMKPDAIFLMSDGVFPPESVQEVVKAIAAEGISTHTIAFQSLDGAALLQAIAVATQGKFRYVD